MSKARRTAGKKVGKCGGKKIPVVGIAVSLYFFSEDVEAMGFWAASGNAIADATPVVGLVQGVYEVGDAANDYWNADVSDEEITNEIWSEMQADAVANPPSPQPDPVTPEELWSPYGVNPVWQ